MFTSTSRRAEVSNRIATEDEGCCHLAAHPSDCSKIPFGNLPPLLPCASEATRALPEQARAPTSRFGLFWEPLSGPLCIKTYHSWVSAA